MKSSSQNVERTDGHEHLETLLTRWESIAELPLEKLKDRIAAAEQALRPVLESEHPDQQARALYLLGSAHFQLGDFTAAIPWLLKIADHADKFRSYKNLSTVIRNLGVAYMNTGDTVAAENYMLRSLALNQEASDSGEMAKDYCNLGVLFRLEGDHEKSLDYSEKAKKIFVELNDHRGINFIIGNIGIIYIELGEFTKALEYKQKELDYFRKTNDQIGLSRCLSAISVIYNNIGIHKKAIDYGTQSLKIKEGLDIGGIASSFLNLGVFYHDSGHLDKAKELYLKALDNSREEGNKYCAAKTLNNLGNLLQKNHQLDESLERYYESIEIWKEIGKESGTILPLTNIGKILSLEMDQDQAGLEMVQKALSMAEDVGDLYHQANLLIILAEIHNKCDQPEPAQSCLKNALDLIQTNNYLKLEPELYETLATLSILQKEYLKAYDYHLKYSETKDRLNSEHIREQITKMRIRYETERKEKEAEIFRQKNIELSEKNELIERQRKKLQETLDRLYHSEIKYDIVADEFKKNAGSDLIGESNAIRDIINLISVVGASRDTYVLITGESGTGKEIVARKLHECSQRKHKNFCSVNSSAIPESLFESEFFGHEKNAFTGANRRHIGWFEKADGGSLFLDEIGTMQPDRQVKLLRVLEEKKIVRVGSHDEIPVDVRVISATNTNLSELVDSGVFREDLFHRLSNFVINIPSLRERIEDVPLLLEHFVKMFSRSMNKKIHRIDSDISKALMGYSFPGNVRELKNIVERAIIMADSSFLKLKHFHIPHSESGDTQSRKIIPLHELEKSMIITALKATGYHQIKTAELLGVDRKVIKRRIQKYNIEIRK